MNNPVGPYPGRQLFLGVSQNNEPLFAYLITGRSPESRERKAVLIDDLVRIGPLGNQAYDPLRHYSAVKFDNLSGTCSVSNGIQTEAVFEIYKLLFNTGSACSKEYLENILDGAGSEPDSYHTPRIAGVIVNPSKKDGICGFFAGIKAYSGPARAAQVNPKKGTLIGISTYKGSLDSPEATDPAAALPLIEFSGNSPADLAEYLFDISAASYNSKDIRVCTVGGVFTAGSGWSISVKNVHQG